MCSARIEHLTGTELVSKWCQGLVKSQLDESVILHDISVTLLLHNIPAFHLCKTTIQLYMCTQATSIFVMPPEGVNWEIYINWLTLHHCFPPPISPHLLLLFTPPVSELIVTALL